MKTAIFKLYQTTKTVAAVAFFAWLLCLAAAPQRATAQLPTDKPIGILAPQTLPPLLDTVTFGARLASEQAFLSMPGHPQTYRLDLCGWILPQFYLGGSLTHEASGLRNETTGEIDLAVDLALSPDWRFFGGINGAVGYRHYRSTGIISEYPFYDEAIADGRFRYTVGTTTNAIYGWDDYRLGFGIRADLATDNKAVSTVSHFFFDSDPSAAANVSYRAYLIHSFYSDKTVQNYYKAGLRLDIFQRRFAVEAAYEASADIQTVGAGLSVGICKGLSLSYDLSMPFRFNGRHAGAVAHTFALNYHLNNVNNKHLNTNNNNEN